MVWKTRPLIDRLGEKLKATPSGCWEFQGCKYRPFGYGKISVDGIKQRSTHRVMWEIVFGPIPDGMCVLHKCDNPPCANPAHLFLGTHTDNVHDRDRKSRGRFAKGEKHGAAKLTWDQVRAIRADDRSCHKIAPEYGVRYQHISKIKRKEIWKE